MAHQRQLIIVQLCVCILINVIGMYNARGSSFDALVDEFWQWRLDESPEYGTKYGIHDRDDRLEEFTEEAFSRQLIRAKELLKDVVTFDETELSQQQKFSKQILEFNLETFIDGYAFRKYGIYNFYSPMRRPIVYWRILLSQMKFNSMADYEKLFARFHAMPVQISQMMTLMRKSIEMGTQQHEVSFTGALDTLNNELNADTTASLFYSPFTQLPSSFSESQRSVLIENGTRLIEDTIRPAVQSLKDFVEDTLLPNTRSDLGAGSLDGGSEFYQKCVEWHTTTSLTAQEIFDLGVKEVERIAERMQEITVSEGFKGTLQDFILHLKEDPNNFYSTGEEMLEAYQQIVSTSHSKIGKILLEVPGETVEVKADWNEQGALGYYADPALDGSRPGMFYANVANSQSKLKMIMTSLAWHEAEPGHHTQMSFSIEKDIPDFRRAIEFRKYVAVPFNWPFMTAYVEGWALYAEALGEEYGAYTDSLTLLGRLDQEMLRAVRLVVDTGIHAFGWTYDRALSYMANYTTLPESSLRNEINRYVSWPGQATAYKIGELKIWELRKRAENQLGADFDKREFHTRVLELGPAPLFVLEEYIEEWISQKQMTSSSPSHRPMFMTMAAFLNFKWLI